MFNKAIAHDHDYDPSYLHLGKLYRAIGKYEESIRHYTKSLEINKKKELLRLEELKE